MSFSDDLKKANINTKVATPTINPTQKTTGGFARDLRNENIVVQPKKEVTGITLKNATRQLQKTNDFQRELEKLSVGQTYEKAQPEFARILRDTASDYSGIGKNLARGVGTGAIDAENYISKLESFNPLAKVRSNLEDKIIQNTQGPFAKDLMNLKSTSILNKLGDIKSNTQKDILETTRTMNSPVSEKISELAPSVGQMLPGFVGGPLGAIYSTSSAAGSYYDEAKSRGMNENQALVQGGILGAAEGLVDKFQIGKLKGAGKTIAKGSGIKNIGKAVKDFGINVGTDFIQEAVMEPITEGVTTLVGGKDKANFENIQERMIQSGIDGALTSLLLVGGTAGISSALKINNKIQEGKTVTTPEIKQAINDIQDSGIANVSETFENEFKQVLDKEMTNYIPEIQKMQNNATSQAEVGMRSKAENYLSKKKSNFVNSIVESLQTTKTGNKEQLNQLVDNITNKYMQDGVITPQEKSLMFDEIYGSLQKMDTDYYNEYSDLRKELKDTKFKIDDIIKKDITDFNDFRKSNFGNIKLSTKSDAISVDSKYQELSTRYPNLFPDTINVTSEQIKRISEVAKDIKISKTNVQSYIDKNLGPEYKEYAKYEFDTQVDKFVNELSKAKKYNDDVSTKKSAVIDLKEATEIYEIIDEYKKTYDKAFAKELLTKKDIAQVDRLLNQEITIDELPNDVNKKGIINVYESKQQYDILQKALFEYNKSIKEKRIKQATIDIGNILKWKDKKLGLSYSTETAERNIYDITPKHTADVINKNYIQSYKKNETVSIKEANSIKQQIRALNIKDSKIYKIDGFDKKLSESSLIQLLGENKIDLDQIKKSGADVKKISDSVEVFRNIFNDLIEKANVVLVQTGEAPVKYRKDYFPHFTDDKQDTLLGKIAKIVGIDLSNQALPTDIAGLTQNFKPGKKWFGNFLQRQTDITDYDAKKGLDIYLNGILDIIHHTEDIKKFRALETAIRDKFITGEMEKKIQEIKDSKSLSSTEKDIIINNIYAESLDRTKLSNFVTWLQNYTNLLAGKKSASDRDSEYKLSRSMYNTMQNLENKITANMVGLNLSTAISNIGVLAQAAGELKTINIAQGMWNTMKYGLKVDNSLPGESDFITRRLGTDKLSKTNTEKVVDVLNAPLALIDRFSTEIIIRGKYAQNLQEGMSKLKALEDADMYASRLIADRSKGALPTIFYDKNPLSKLTTMFQVEVNNQWRYLAKDMPRNMTPDKLVLGYLKVAIGSYLMNELIGNIRGKGNRLLPDPIYIIMELAKSLTDDDDDNDGEAFLNSGKEILSTIPFISVPAAIFGIDDLGRIPISAAIPDLGKIGKNSLDIFKGTGDENSLKNIGKELGESLSYLVMPAGAGQLKKSIEGLSLYDSKKPVAGSYTDKGDLKFTADTSALGKIKSGLFGQYASDSANEYVKSGFKTISEKNVKELSDLDMTSEEYKKFSKSLNLKRGLKEKIEFVDNYDLTDSQKNIVIKNLTEDKVKDKNGYQKYIEKDVEIKDSKGFVKCKLPGKDTIYWYDKKNNTLYNNNYKKVKDVNKSKLELVKEDKTYWYDEKKENLYDENYKEIKDKNIDKLKKYELNYNIEDYKKYNSFDEYEYSIKNPEIYNAIIKITSFDNFDKYKKDIDKIKDKYNSSTERQKAVSSYINKLDLSSGKKTMMLKLAGGYGIDKYKKQMQTYINSLDITAKEKSDLYKTLGY